MAIEFREVRRGEIDDALAFALGRGAAIERATLQANLSLVALGQEKATLGSALHHVDDTGRRHVAVHLAEDVHPGLARLLIDRALRKAEAADVSTTHVQIDHDETSKTTWNQANWLLRLTPSGPKPAAEPTPAEPLVGASAEPENPPEAA